MATLLSVGAPQRKKLDGIRGKVASLRDEIEQTREATLPADVAAERCMAAIRQRAARPTGGLASYSRPGTPTVYDVRENARSPVEVEFDIGSLFSLAPAFVEENVRAYFSRICSKAGLPPAERTERVTELEKKLADLLDDEERAILALEAEDFLVERVAPDTHADVERILRIWAEAAA